MKVLVVVPWAPSKIRPRSLRFIEHLRMEHEVTVVGAVWSKRERVELESLSVAHVVTVPLTRFPALIRAGIGLLKGTSLQQSYVDARAFRNAIRAESRRFDPDFCYFNVIRTAQLAKVVPNIPKILDLDEFRSKYYEQMSTKGSSCVWRQIAKVEAKRLARAEDVAMRAFDRVIVSSPADLRASQPHVSLVRTAHSVAMCPATKMSAAHALSIVFVGRQNYRANYEAASWFVRDVMPLIRAQIPNLKLSIVGDKPARRLTRLASSDVEVTGRVDDVADYYRAANVSIVPVSLATGVQMKLIEALSFGTPTVVTERVAEGAGVQHEDQCLVANSASGWASAIVRLLNDDELQRKLARSGHLWANAHHSSEAVMRAFDDVVSCVAEKMRHDS